MSDVLNVSQHDRVRVIRLHRPEKMNALSDELAWEIVHAMADAASDESTWVIGLTGSGAAFCAGLDLTPDGDGGSYSGLSDQDLYLDELHWVGRFCHDLRMGCDKPIVAGINGVAVGAGLALALAADMRLMARSARLIAGYPRMGGSPDGGMSWTLAQLVGYEQAMRFLLENRTITGDEAVELGLVGEAVDDDAFEDRFHEYLAQLAELSPITARSTKRVVRAATAHPDLRAHLRYELQSIQRAFASRDGREARQAFLEKRAPSFQGR
jgi:2-(1,2-epoxy-1,2-dihydrophenyl)acetyl-CoA isomerase